MSVKFFPISSSSRGNSIYIATEETNILVDAGVSCKNIEERLLNFSINPKILDAILITHEHTDHILGAGIISRKYNIPIYSTVKTWDYIDNKNIIGKIKKHNKKYVYEDEKIIINDMIINSFKVPHDAKDPICYTICTKDKKISILTDLGHITNCIKENVYNSDILLLESNYDINMIKYSNYNDNLKKRILGDYGHLSNEDAGNFLREIISNKLKYVFLGHLSEENNTPELALKTVKNKLKFRENYYKNINLFIAHKDSVKKILVLK